MRLWKDCLLICLFFAPLLAAAQGPQQTGLIPYQSYDESNFDTVDLLGGAVQLHIPILSYPQKGTLPPLGLQLVYNTPSWSQQSNPYNGGGNYVQWYFNGPITSGLAITPSYGGGTFPDGTDSSGSPLQGITATDPTGASHQMLGVVSPAGVQTNMYETIDGSGIGFVATGTGASYLAAHIDRNGIRYSGGCVLYPNSCTSQTATYMQDPSGNHVIINYPAGLTDSIGRSIPLFSNQFATTPTAKCETQAYPVAGGTTAPINICWQQYTATSAFGGADVREGTGTFVAISSITLQNGASWSLTYDSWGFLHSVTTPTGAVMTYAYYPPSQGPQYSVGSRYLETRTLNVNGTTSQWSYAYSTVQMPGNVTDLVTTVTDPLQNTVTHTFDTNGPEVQTVYTQGTAQTLLKTVQHTFVTIGFHAYLPKQTITTYPNGQSTTTCVIYDNNTNTTCTGTDAFNPSGLKVYDPNDAYRAPGFVPYSASLVLGSPMYSYVYDYTTSSSPGVLLSATTNTYQWQVNDSYRAANLVNLVSSTAVSSGGAALTTTTHSYDETAYGPGGVVGNATTEVDGGIVTTHAYYNPNGMVTATQDGKGYTTTIAYDNTGAYPMTITYPSTGNGVSHADSFVYDANTGLMLSHTDENQQPTTYAYDKMRRPTSIGYPDGGQETYTYNDTAPSPTFTHAKALGSSTQLTTIVTADALGRQIRTDLSSDPEGAVYTDTTYDLVGNVQSVSNPYRTTNDATYGITSYAYDALGRKTAQCQPDNSPTPSTTCTPQNSYLQWTYTGGSGVTYKDEAGNTWQRTSDALGHLINVGEPSGASTGYVYDALNNLITVTQHGTSTETARTRGFTYDSLSRLLTASNPETGTITYGYDANSNLTSKADARGVTTSYTYNQMNQMLSSTPSDSSSSQQFTYDSFTQWGGGAATNTIGRLARAYACSGVNCEDDLFGYDLMGRVNRLQGRFPSESSTISHLFLFDYDLAGDQTNVYYGHEVPGNLNRNVYTGYSAAGRPTYVATVYENNALLANNEAYVNWVSYYPDGTPNAIYYDNGTVETLSKNNRLQLCEDSFTGTGSFIDRQYFFGNNRSSGQQCTPTPQNNGNIFQVADALNAPHSQSFTYDSLNRLQTWSTAQFAGAAQQQSFAYDSFGNVNQTNGYPPSAGTPDPLTFPTAYNPQAWPYDANNHLLTSTFKCLPYGVTGTPGQVSGYDAAGNVLCSGQQNSNAEAYIWDGENHLTQLWAQQNNNTYNLKALYSYDSQGNRILSEQMQAGSLPGSSPSTWTSQSFREYANFQGNVLAEMDQNGNWTDYIYGLGKKLASAPTVESEIQMSGSQTAPYNVGYAIDAPSLAGYVFRTGDVLYVRQIQTGSMDGGIEIFTNSGNTSGVMDSSGYQSDDDTLMNTWHLRYIPLTSIVGQTFSSMQIGGGSGSRGQSGAFTANFAEISVFSADGTVRTVYNRGTTASLSYASGSTATVAVQSGPIDSNGIHYFAHDQVGTVQEELSFSGLPIWKGEFAPFGQELDSNLTTERYKFTGKERDQESGLDYFGARYYGSSMGRFMSPDPSGIAYASAANPQSLNLYSYALNNPLRFVDPTGLTACFYGGAGDTPQNDNDASDYEDVPDQQTCQSNGGVALIDNQTANVSASGGSGNYLSLLDGGGSSTFVQFIPGKACSASLSTAGTNGQAIGRYYNNYRGLVGNAASANGISANFLAAVGVRESGMQNIAQSGGQGRGIFQIDLGANPGVSSAQAFNPTFSANFAANMLSTNQTKLAQDHPNLDPSHLAQATAASYNFGTSNISGNPNTIDAGTTGGNYGSNVMAISGNCFN